LYRKLFGFGAALSLLLVCAGPVAAVTMGDVTVSLFVNGGEMDLTNPAMGTMSTEVDPGTGATIFHWDNIGKGNPNFQITLDASLDPDPQIVYAASVIDFGSASTFGFVFQQAIVPTATPGSVSHTHSSSTTDANGGGTPVTAVAPPAGIPVDGDATPEIAVYTVSTNAGTTFLNAGLDLSPSFVGTNPSGTQGPFNEGPAAGPAGSGSYDAMRVDVNFSMAGGSDAYTFNGLASVVPEPATVLLIGGALLALCVRRRAA
jgi:hypothetical protein